jgi:hypothetical protein
MLIGELLQQRHVYRVDIYKGSTPCVLFIPSREDFLEDGSYALSKSLILALLYLGSERTFVLYSFISITPTTLSMVNADIRIIDHGQR